MGAYDAPCDDHDCEACAERQTTVAGDFKLSDDVPEAIKNAWRVGEMNDNDLLMEVVLTLVRLHAEGKDEDFALYALRAARWFTSRNKDFAALLHSVRPEVNASPLRQIDGRAFSHGDPAVSVHDHGNGAPHQRLGCAVCEERVGF